MSYFSPRVAATKVPLSKVLTEVHTEDIKSVDNKLIIFTNVSKELNEGNLHCT